MATSLRPDAPPRGAVRRLLPILDWLPRYHRAWLPRDAIAGITVWALMVPEAMAYAGIAGVPVQYGLYAVPLALLGYAVFGSCPQLFMGPSATVASLSAATVGAVAVAQASPDSYVALTAVLALVVGLLYVVGGLLRLGFIANFFARPVLDGFIIGLGLFIIVGQLPKLVGVEKPSGDTVGILVRTVADAGDWNGVTALVGGVALVLLFGMKRWLPKVPAAIVVVVLSILAVQVFDLVDRGVAVVGSVPTGFGFVSYGSLSWSDVWDVVPGALAVLVVGFAQSVAIAKAYAAEHGYPIDASQEMIGYGATNLGAGALQGFTVTGSLSKSAAAQEARGRSQVAPLVTALLVLLTILFLAGLFENLPETVLAAVVIEAVSGMVRFGKLTALWRARTPEFWAALAALVGVVLIDILPGVVIGVATSFALLIHRLDNPHIARLGRSADGGRYADLDVDPDLIPVPGVLIQRFEGPLVFTNSELFVSRVRAQCAAEDPRPRAVVLDFEGVTQADVTGCDALRRLHEALAADGVRLVLARVSSSVRGQLDRAGVLDLVGADGVASGVREAVDLLTGPGRAR